MAEKILEWSPFIYYGLDESRFLVLFTIISIIAGLIRVFTWGSRLFGLMTIVRCVVYDIFILHWANNYSSVISTVIFTLLVILFGVLTIKHYELTSGKTVLAVIATIVLTVLGYVYYFYVVYEGAFVDYLSSMTAQNYMSAAVTFSMMAYTMPGIVALFALLLGMADAASPPSRESDWSDEITDETEILDPIDM